MALPAPAPAFTPEHLIGREARCTCGASRPSTSEHLAFFEYRGEGSKRAIETCRHCRYAEIAHTQEIVRGPSNSILVHNVVEEGKCPGFEPHGPFDHDTFYCGCRGWD